MARFRKVHKVILFYGLFFGLLLLRFRIDWLVYATPITPMPKPLEILEWTVFYHVIHHGLVCLFLHEGMEEEHAFLHALITMVICIYLHFLDILVPMGVFRAEVYPDQNFFLNLVSAFILTGDAGFWQILRMFAAGVYVLFVLKRHGCSHRKMLIGMSALYVWCMLLTHPYVWVFHPAQDIPTPGAEPHNLYVPILISEIIFFILTTTSVLETWRNSNLQTHRPVFPATPTWCLLVILMMLFTPNIFVTQTVSELFLITLTVINMRLVFYPLPGNDKNIFTPLAPGDSPLLGIFWGLAIISIALEALSYGRIVFAILFLFVFEKIIGSKERTNTIMSSIGTSVILYTFLSLRTGG